MFASGVISLQFIVAWQGFAIRIKQATSPEGGGLGGVVAALTGSKKALEIDPNFVHAHFHRGMTYLRKEAFADAIAEFQKAVSLSPNVTDYKGGLAESALKHASCWRN